MKVNILLLLILFISVIFFIIGVSVLQTDPMSYMNFNFSGDPATYNAILNGHIVAHRWIGGILFATGSFGIISNLQKFQK